MPILFRCPCGRSMVAESRKAGQTIVCPNCHRGLKVPTGKGRGKEIKKPPPTAARPSGRTCHRCDEPIPADVQMCPHCNAILMDSPTGGGPVTVRLGGSRSSWWSDLSSGAKAGVVVGIGALFLLILFVVVVLVVPAHKGSQRVRARTFAKSAVEEGRRQEAEGRFQKAYDTYLDGLIRERYLMASADAEDRELVRRLRARANALQYIVPSPRTSEQLRWKPASSQELDQAAAQIRSRYPSYRQRILAVTGGGMEAIRTARTDSSREAYAAKVAAAMDSYVELIRETTPQQRALWSFTILVQAMDELASANREWDDRNQRRWYLGTAETRLELLEKRVREPPLTPEGDVFDVD